MDFVGIGDLHFDGVPIKYVHDLNQRIATEVEVVFDYARRKGITNVFFYGDVAHRPNISMEAQVIFFHLLRAAYDLRIFVLAGNHDFHSRKDADKQGVHSSLEMFNALQHTQAFKHCTVVIDKPKLIEIDGEGVHLMPWPHKKLRKDALNVIHVETKGSKWETGREVDKDCLDSTGFNCVAGHLHTNQTIGSTYYSGTLYQTNFGEKPDKFFHHGRYVNGKLRIKNVPHKPFMRLHNIVLNGDPKPEDIPNGQGDLCKVFVKKGTALDANFLEQYPSVVKINSFASKAELSALMKEELKLDESVVEFNDDDYLMQWLKGQSFSKEQVKSILKTNARLKGEQL